MKPLTLDTATLDEATLDEADPARLGHTSR
jgi:hypothetical protein